MPDSGYPQFNLPSRAELGAVALFGPTQQEREVAGRLYAIAPESGEEQHPSLLLRALFPEGSEAERLAWLTPSGRIAAQIIAESPEESCGPELVPVLTDEELKPIRRAVSDTPMAVEEPEEGVSMRLLRGLKPEPSELIVIRPIISYPKPIVEGDWGGGFERCAISLENRRPPGQPTVPPCAR